MTRTAAVYFFKADSGKYRVRSRTLVKVRAQLVDGREPHHAFWHLCLDRAIGIQRIGHSIDDARFENRYRRLILASRGRRIAIRRRGGGVRFGKGGGRAAAAPRRRIDGPRAFRFWPGVVERRGRHPARFGRRRHGGRRGTGSCRTKISRGWLGRSRLGALAFLPR